MTSINKDFDIKIVFNELISSYKPLYEKKFKIEKKIKNKYIFKYWKINDFLLYCYNNKFIYNKIIQNIKRYDNFDVFFYLHIKKIDHGDNIYIATMELYEEYPKVIDFVGFFSTFYDEKKNYCFAEHFLINQEYRGLGLCKIMVKYWNRYYTKLHTMPVYGAVLKSNTAALKCFESGGYNMINEMSKHKDQILTIAFDPIKYLKEKKEKKEKKERR